MKPKLHNTPLNFILDNLLCMSAYWACSGTIVASLTAYYDFSLALSNVLTGFTATLPIFQLFGGLAYSASHRPLRFLRFFNGVWRLLLPVVFFSVLLPGRSGGPLMLLAYLLCVSIYQFATPSQTNWMVSSVEGKVSGSYYSRRETFFMSGYTVIFCLTSLIVDHANKTGTQQQGFVQLGILSSLLIAGSLVILFAIPAPEQQPSSPSFALLAEPLRNRAFRRLIVANGFWCFFNMFISSYAAVYQIRVLHMDFFHIMLYSTVANLTRTLCIPLMARLADRIGWRRVGSLSCAMMAVCGCLWFFTTAENAAILFPLATVANALPFSGLGVALLKLQIAASPDENRSIYFSVNALCNGCTALLGSLSCSALIGLLEGVNPALLPVIFAIGVLGVLIAALAMLRVRSMKELSGQN